jgi:COP9 signalosome complex subunit 1
MSTAFNTNVAGLEKELTRLIMENKIQARIDSHNKILYARHADQRSTTFHKALNMGETYQNNVQSMLLRANLLMTNFAVQQPKERDPRESGRDYRDSQMRD